MTNLFMMDDKILTDQGAVSIKSSASDLEKLLKESNYKGQRLVKDPLVERSGIPSLMVHFMTHFIAENIIPTDEAFAESYLEEHFTPLHDETNEFFMANNGRCPQPLWGEGIRARALRAYPSLIRDVHFYLLCQESKLFDKVVYSLEKDIKGVDLEITQEGVCYSVSLFVQTNRSLHYKKMKYSRHDYSERNEICVALDFQKCLKAGDFFLYDSYHVRNVMREIRNRQKKAVS